MMKGENHGSDVHAPVMIPISIPTHGKHGNGRRLRAQLLTRRTAPTYTAHPIPQSRPRSGEKGDSNDLVA